MRSRPTSRPARYPSPGHDQCFYQPHTLFRCQGHFMRYGALLSAIKQHRHCAPPGWQPRQRPQPPPPHSGVAHQQTWSGNWYYAPSPKAIEPLCCSRTVCDIFSAQRCSHRLRAKSHPCSRSDEADEATWSLCRQTVRLAVASPRSMLKQLRKWE